MVINGEKARKGGALSRVTKHRGEGPTEGEPEHEWLP